MDPEVTESEEGQSPPPTRTPRFTASWMRWLVVVLVIVFAFLTAIAVDRTGVRARSLASGAFVAQTATETVSVLESLGARGAVALVVTEDLGYAPVSIESSPGVLRWPVARTDLREHYRAGVDRDSWVWVLSKTGMVRRVDYLLPPAAFERRVTEGRAAGLPGIAGDGRSVLANDEGFVRHISDTPRALDDPLVVIIDASYFRTGVAADLAARLQQVDRAPIAVVLSRAIEDTSVPESARDALDGALSAIEKAQP